MRQESITVFSASDVGSGNGAKIDSGQLVNCSFHIIFSDTDAAGSVKIQASNDPVPSGAQRNQFTPTNWVDIPSASVTITAGGQKLISLPNIAYNWMRVVWTQTTPGTGNLIVYMDGLGA